jgi:LPS export ABC transporter protein LptC
VDLNIKHFLALLFVLTMAAVFFLKPHQVDVVKKRDLPQIEFSDFESYEITPQGVDALLQGAQAQKFIDYLYVTYPHLKRRSPQGIESMTANEAFFYDHKGIRLKEKVVLSRSDGWRILTERIYYALKEKYYSTEGFPFTAYYGQSVVMGKNMVYRQKSGKITADSIRAIIDKKVDH